MYIYIYMYMYRDRNRDRERKRERERDAAGVYGVRSKRVAMLVGVGRVHAAAAFCCCMLLLLLLLLLPPAAAALLCICAGRRAFNSKDCLRLRTCAYRCVQREIRRSIPTIVGARN